MFLRQPWASILVILISNALAVNPLSVKKSQVSFAGKFPSHLEFKLLTSNKPEKYLEHDTDKLGSR